MWVSLRINFLQAPQSWSTRSINTAYIRMYIHRTEYGVQYDPQILPAPISPARTVKANAGNNSTLPLNVTLLLLFLLLHQWLNLLWLLLQLLLLVLLLLLLLWRLGLVVIALRSRIILSRLHRLRVGRHALPRLLWREWLLLGRPRQDSLHRHDRIRSGNEHRLLRRVAPPRRGLRPKAVALTEAEREKHHEADKHEGVVEEGFDDVPYGNRPIGPRIKVVGQVDEPEIDENGHTDKVTEKIKDDGYQEQGGALGKEKQSAISKGAAGR